MKVRQEEASFNLRKIAGPFYVSLALFEELSDKFNKMFTKKLPVASTMQQETSDSADAKAGGQKRKKNCDPLRLAFNSLLSRLLYGTGSFNFREPFQSGSEAHTKKKIIADKIVDYLFDNKKSIETNPSERQNYILSFRNQEGIDQIRFLPLSLLIIFI